MAKYILWISVALIFYTYVGYLIFLAMLSCFHRKKVIKDSAFRPRVSLIIAAHNEEKSIEEKLKNTLDLDYPVELLEIIVTSDCSSDRTDDIVKGYSNRNILLFQNVSRVGKTEAQNKAVEIALGSILLFSDATTFYNKDLVKKIVRNFADPAVGCVEGKLVFVKDINDRYVRKNGFFTQIELLIREKEGEINSVVGVSGCVYAVRKELYQPMNKNLVSDLAISFIIHDQGYRIIHEKEAVAFEEYAPDLTMEMKRNIRTVCQGWVAATILCAERIKKRHYFYYDLFYIQFISHKLLRWLSPFLLGVIFITNTIIIMGNGSSFYVLFLLIQLIYYGFGMLNIACNMRYTGKISFLNIPVYFFLYNVAGAIGFYKYLWGDKKPAWSTAR